MKRPLFGLFLLVLALGLIALAFFAGPSVLKVIFTGATGMPQVYEITANQPVTVMFSTSFSQPGVFIGTETGGWLIVLVGGKRLKVRKSQIRPPHEEETPKKSKKKSK